MIIKVCGMRDAQNIREVMTLGVDMIGMIFWPKSPRFVPMVRCRAGIIPDKASSSLTGIEAKQVKRVGVFVDAMPQEIITCAYNYHLDYIQLHGSESPVMIDNLRRTLVPDILPEVRIIKALSIREADDVKRWREYEGHADMLLFDTKCKCVGGSGEQFDWSVLEGYDGSIPFLLSGGIGPDDAERVKAFRHPMLAGIDLNSRFEIEPALKDVAKLENFIKEIRK